jgi:hypothetical protein
MVRLMEIKVEGLNELASKMTRNAARFDKKLQEGINKAVLIIQNSIRKETPVRTGRLKRSVQAEILPLSGRVYTNLNYAMYVHEGTGPYTIYPKTKKALFWKGALHPVRKVNHPGIKANPFFERGFDQSKDLAIDAISKKIDESLEEIARK